MSVKEKSKRASLKLNIKKKKKTKIMGTRPQYFMANRRGKGERSGSFLLIGLSNHCGL